VKRFIQAAVVLCGVAVLSLAYAGGGSDKAPAAMQPGKCTFANVAQMKKHAGEHMKFPAKGAAVKAACKKELPDEFSKDEWACFDASIKDDTEYKSTADVLKAVGVTP
jgi:hypothetical protein